MRTSTRTWRVENTSQASRRVEYSLDRQGRCWGWSHHSRWVRFSTSCLQRGQEGKLRLLYRLVVLVVGMMSWHSSTNWTCRDLVRLRAWAWDSQQTLAMVKLDQLLVDCICRRRRGSVDALEMAVRYEELMVFPAMFSWV
jgi:hypothetical protein